MKNSIALAIKLAVKAHLGQVRKGTDIPYIVHPMSVGILLAQAGCRDALIAAGILHDVVEDTSYGLDYIRENFGEEVAFLVEGCSEPDKSLPWYERKKHTIEYLKTAPRDVKIVSCADKLDNIKSIADDFEKIGDKVWDRFNAPKEKQEWYYMSLVKSLCDELDITEDEVQKSPNLSILSLLQQFKEEVANLFGRT